MNKYCVRLAILVAAISVSVLGCKSSTDPAKAGSTPLSGTIYYNTPPSGLYRLNLGSGNITSIGFMTAPNALSDGWILGLDKNGFLAEMSADGAQSDVILQNSAQRYAVVIGSPQASPDGQYIAYDDGGSMVFVVDMDGNLQYSIGDATHRFVRPVWGPDGSLYMAGDFGNYGLYKFAPDFSSYERLDPNLTKPTHPAVNPAGTQIAFILDSHIWTMNTDGTNLQQVTTGSGSEDWPVWSPDGKWIAAHASPSNELIAVQPGTTNIVHFNDQYSAFDNKNLIPASDAQLDWK